MIPADRKSFLVRFSGVVPNNSAAMGIPLKELAGRAPNKTG